MKSKEGSEWVDLVLIMKEGKSTYAFFLMIKKLMTLYGGMAMGYGIKCGNGY